MAEAGQDTIQVRGHYNYPPYEFLDDTGNATGFNVEVIQAVAKIMGLEINLELGPWEEITTALESGTIDALIGVYYSPERAEKFDFTIPYETVSYSLFVRKESSMSQLDDLHDKAIVLVQGGSSINFINNRNLTQAIYQVASSVDALRLLSAGNYDCSIVPEVQGQYFVRRYGLQNLKAVGPNLLPRNLSFAVAKGNPELLLALNQGLRIIKNSGQFDQLHRKWIDRYQKQETVNEKWIKYTIWIGVILLILFLVAIGWGYSMRGRVNEKTKHLQGEISERKRVEDALHQANRLQEIIYQIANAARGADNLKNLFIQIRNILHDVIDTSNFYIALLSRDRKLVHFPYWVDEMDDDASPISADAGLTGYLLKVQRPLIFTKEDILGLVARGIVERLGTPSEYWLGVPLRVDEQVVGAVVIQSYNNSRKFTTKDLEILEFVSNEIADVIHHKQDQDAIIESEEKYRRLSIELTEANNMKELLLDVITHDLKNPAGVIQGMSEILLDEEFDNENIALINESCGNLLKVIDNAVILSKLTLGEEISKEAMDLAELIRQVANEMKSTLASADMELLFSYDEPLPICVNPIIVEIFKNYISNAIKYSRDGKKIEVNIRKDTDSVTVDFIDFGPTIPEEKRPLIFNRGVQLSAGAKLGRGLGLAIVKRIAEAHDGKVGVLPNKPRGNIFYLQIPLT
ncbi:MAG: transporter substrate-binding domain-containing protein [Candidatus Neomarinimicrobiota bacterium]